MKKIAPLTKIKKRNGQLVPFDQGRIENAIFKAITAVSAKNGNISKKLSAKVVKILGRRFKDVIPSVEDIQNIVEEVLILSDLVKEAKAYILYREQHSNIRDMALSMENVAVVDQYLGEKDWEVKENANMSYSLQGLNNYISNTITKNYWLHKIYPVEIRDAVKSGDFHLHNLGILAPYCMGWDLYDFLSQGFTGVFGKISSKPPKHFRAALGQIVNFIYTVQGECAGAVAFSSFDTFLAPFIRYDKLTYPQVKQAMQEFLFNCNVPTRVGFQTPFENVTIDLVPPEALAKSPVIIGGKLQKETYGEFQKEMDMFNRAFAEVMCEGDAHSRIFTFPIPTYNITKNFDWENPALKPLWEMTAKFGIPYFSNFINSDLNPEDVRSMCCRLRLETKTLHHRGGGLFGSAPLTGSIGVVTINLPRIGYLAKSDQEFFEKLGHVMDLARESLEIKRKTLEELIEKGLYPYSKFYLRNIKQLRGNYWANHFSTIGLIGMNEMLLNFMGENIISKSGREFALKVLDFMRERLVTYQNETGNIYNLEATPAEGTSYRLARQDKAMYPDIITAGKETPYYTNSTQLQVDYQGGLFEALKFQDEFQIKYTGGTVFHAFLGEKISDVSVVKKIIKKVFENFRLPYFTLSPTFSICPNHGYLSGEQFKCPQCGAENEVYSRVVGYYRPVQQWNKGKQEEYQDRQEFDITL
ncbi:MAG: ribonucleoside triphosphate reductase [Patescibacteria group bacterium]